MTKIDQVYKCSVCGNVVQILEEGTGQLVCCGQPMNLQEKDKPEAETE